MKISKDEYLEYINKFNNGELEFYIDTAGCREFLFETEHEKFENEFGVTIKKEVKFLKNLYLLEHISLYLVVILTILAYNYWAILIVPLYYKIYFFIRARASLGYHDIFKPFIIFTLFTIIMLCFLGSHSKIIQIHFVSIQLPYFFVKLMYYYTSKYTYNILLSNYNFFAYIYLKPFQEDYPMLWTYNNVTKETDFKWKEIDLSNKN